MDDLNNSSDDLSTDEEEVLNDFDKEAQLIINSETLPKKSSDRYLQVYQAFKNWLNENKNHVSSSHENNLIIYFNSLKEKLKPSTLWSIWSMLKKTLNTRDQIDIDKFFNLKAMLKTYAKGYKPKKSLVFKWQEIEKFIKEADDHVFLALKVSINIQFPTVILKLLQTLFITLYFLIFFKVILIFGICGALRCDEIFNLKVNDIEDLGNRYLVTIQTTKNDYNTETITASRQLLIGSLFYNIIKKYISLRPTEKFTDKFFIRYQQGKCIRQVIGINKIYEIPRIIATYLKLNDPKKYTGHCYRRTGATLLAESGADFSKVKQLGGWVSDKVCHGYVENSIHNRQTIFDGVTHASTTNSNSTTSNVTPAPTLTAIQENLSDYVLLDWDDFSTDITMDDLDRVPISKLNQSKTDEPKFVSAKNQPINDQQEKSTTGAQSNSTLFSSKPPIKIQFKNSSTPPPKKRIKVDSSNNNNTSLGATGMPTDDREPNLIANEKNNLDLINEFKNSYVKYENCTFYGNITNNF